MLVLVTGGSGSGKSVYAEECAACLAGDDTKYYLAAMQVCDEESAARVRRHREQRRGKGFVTIEQPVSVSRALEKMEPQKTALLECMSNLTANEMFPGGPPKSCGEVRETILREVALLRQSLSDLVIVTDNVFEDGIRYDASTMEYLSALGQINRGLAEAADKVVEVVAGIPIEIKVRR